MGPVRQAFLGQKVGRGIAEDSIAIYRGGDPKIPLDLRSGKGFLDDPGQVYQVIPTEEAGPGLALLVISFFHVIQGVPQARRSGPR